MNRKNDKCTEPFKNNTVMLTDLMEKTDPLSKGLLEYFEKNFDVNLSRVKQKYPRNR